jgi:hypothetical protein
MTADEPNEAVANIAAAIKDFFMVFLVKNQPRHAAWFSRIGELHASKLTTKRTQNDRCVRFCTETCRFSILSCRMRIRLARHRGTGQAGIDKTAEKRVFHRICGPRPTPMRVVLLGRARCRFKRFLMNA